MEDQRWESIQGVVQVTKGWMLYPAAFQGVTTLLCLKALTFRKWVFCKSTLYKAVSKNIPTGTNVHFLFSEWAYNKC